MTALSSWGEKLESFTNVRRKIIIAFQYEGMKYDHVSVCGDRTTPWSTHKRKQNVSFVFNLWGDKTWQCFITKREYMTVSVWDKISYHVSRWEDKIQPRFTSSGDWRTKNKFTIQLQARQAGRWLIKILRVLGGGGRIKMTFNKNNVSQGRLVGRRMTSWSYKSVVHFEDGGKGQKGREGGRMGISKVKRRKGEGEEKESMGRGGAGVATTADNKSMTWSE